jgi:hypothetical protein
MGNKTLDMRVLELEQKVAVLTEELARHNIGPRLEELELRVKYRGRVKPDHVRQRLGDLNGQD